VAYDHPAALEIEQLLRQCSCRRTRRSGPGGQHRNKVETAMVIEHEPTGVVAEANERRSLEENRQMAIHRLRVRLAATVRSESSELPPLSELWRKRSTSGKMNVSDLHEDFPALLAEALDRLSIAQFQTSEAAKHLGVTTTSLVNLLAKSAEALAMVNRERSARGMPKLRPS
jgi:hypothetical protein